MCGKINNKTKAEYITTSLTWNTYKMPTLVCA